MRRVALLLALSACDAVLGLQPRPVDPFDAPPPGCLRDDFSAGLAGSRWDVIADPSFGAAVVDNALHLSLGEQLDGVAQCSSAQPHDFTGGVAEVTVSRTVNPRMNIENFFAVWRDPANFYYLLVEYRGTRLVLSAAVKRNNAYELDRAITLDALAHQRWRIRHEATEPAEIVFETSPGDGTWTERHRIPALIDVTGVRFLMMADAYAGGALEPGVAVYDDFLFCPRAE